MTVCEKEVQFCMLEAKERKSGSAERQWKHLGGPESLSGSDVGQLTCYLLECLFSSCVLLEYL